MAEQLGQAVLTISADTRQLDAGLQRARQQAEQAGAGISNALSNAAQGTASTVRNIQELQNILQGLQQQQVQLDIDSSEFKVVQQDIIRVKDELQAIERRRLLIDVDSNSITAVVTRLQSQLEQLRRQQISVDIDSSEFAAVSRQIGALEGELLALESRKVVASVDDRSIVALQSQLQNLQQRQVKLDVNSSEFKDAEVQIRALQQQLAGFERRRLLINVDSNSITAITAELQSRLNALQDQQLKVNVDSQEFQSLGAEIGVVAGQLEALQRRVLTVSVDAGSLEGIQGRLQDLQQRQAKVNVDSSDFEDLQRQIVATQAELAKIDSRRIRIDVDANSITAQTTRLKAELDALRQRQVKIDVDSGEFATVSRQIRLLEGELDALDRRRITASVDDRSIVALQTRLQGLRRDFESTEIGTRQFRQLNREIQATERELARFSGAQRGGLGGIGGILGGLGLGFGAGAAVTGFFKGAIDQAIQLETVTRKLSNTLGAQGAGEALNFTKGLANELGLNFRTLADSFARFTAAATAASVPLQTQRDLFAAVSKAGQSLGLGNDEINGSFLALQQIASKGVVSFEELRQQLGERLPIALSATAKGLGISQQELIKLVESGKLTANQFFPALTKGLNELTAGAGGFETTAQKLSKFRNAWEELQAGLGQNLLPGITKSVEGLTAALEGLRAEQAGRELQRAFDLPLGDAVALSAQLQQLQQKYNLSDEAAKKFLGTALKDAGGSKNLFGQLTLSGEQYARVQLRLIDLASKFRAANPDQLAAAQAEEARRKQALDQEEKLTAERQKQLDIQLKQSQADLQLRNSQDRLEAVRLTPGLDEAGRTRLQNELALNEKIREVEATRLALQRELAKPKGSGDGKPTAQGAPTQNQATIDELQRQFDRGRLDVTTLRLQNQQTEAAALRTQQERISGQQLEARNAQARLAITERQIQLERDALANGREASRTELVRLQQWQAFSAAVRSRNEAQKALNAELSKPKDQQDRVVLEGLFARVSRANQDVRQSYADAGLALLQNARNAADALKSAQQSFNSTARGGFEFLTPGEQQRQLIQARESVQRGINSGLIRADVNVGSRDRLFQVAAFSDSLLSAQKQLEQAIKENAAATSRLADKRWDVFVSIPGQPTFVPLTGKP